MSNEANPEGLNKEAIVDNSHLEELMKIDPQEMTPQDQQAFLNLLKVSQLYIPIEINVDAFDIENAEVGEIMELNEEVRFEIIAIENKTGKNTLVLFTSEEVMEEVGLNTNRMAIFMSDLAGMIKGGNEFYSEIMINPNTDYSMGMSFDNFISLFDDENESEDELQEMMEKIYDLLENNYDELDGEYVFYHRAESKFMEEDSIDGVYTSPLPFLVSTELEFQNNLPYLNKIIMKEGQKVVYIGNPDSDEGEADILIAPDTVFKKYFDEDSRTTIWECIKQPFYDEHE